MEDNIDIRSFPVFFLQTQMNCFANKLGFSIFSFNGKGSVIRINGGVVQRCS